MSDDSDFHLSEEDDHITDTKHARIVENILNLNKSQHLKKPSRTEPSLHISEFNLIKSVAKKNGSIHIEDLTKSLKSKKQHAKTTQKIESTIKKARTLPKSLEKPESDKIRRSVGYERNRFLLDRWEAFVTSNRAQAHQVFPLDKVEKIKVEAKKAALFPSSWTYKSKLEQELEQIQPRVETYHIEDDEGKELSTVLEGLKEKRKYGAKLRALQSYNESKARRQKKIKSKKYRRILRKEKIKEKLKEFEKLQKSDPEAALKKLEEIEKARALERFSLRHRNTGQWAKSKQVRAKYDKETRQVLAEQLKISKELTQKQKVISDSEEEEEEFETEDISNSNVLKSNDNHPWPGQVEPSPEVSDFVNNYRKFWSNKMQQANGKNDNDELENMAETNNEVKPQEEVVIATQDDLQKQPLLETNTRKKKKKVETEPSVKKDSKICQESQSGLWSIEEIFTSADTKIAGMLKRKLSNVTKNKVKGKEVSKTKNKTKKANTVKVDLSMPSQHKRQLIDEEMLERPFNENQETEENKTVGVLKAILQDNLDPVNSPSSKNVSEEIGLEQFTKPNVTNLASAQPDLIVEGDDSEKNTQVSVMLEALDDDDIAADFAKEKQSELEKDKPKDIDLNLPGWGSWAGMGINPKKQRKRRRFIVKMPEVLPRRDENKGLLIINEKAAAKIKPHLVSQVPFPFKTVKDYEASIRAPISNSFVPELAYRRYIKPSVTTRMGTIIEPVNTSHLMGIPKS